MIQIDTMYELYYAYINKKIELLKLEIEELQINVNIIKSKLLEYKDVISNFVKIEDILEGKVDKLPDSDSKIIHYINIQIRNYKVVQLPIKTKNREMEKLSRQVLTFLVYKKVIKKFNSKLTDVMIKEGYVFKLPFSLGQLAVCKKTTKKKRVDWGTSNRNKDLLIKQNKTPYLKEEAETAFKKGIKYEGEPWLAYHPDTDLWFVWKVPRKAPVDIRNYIFKPARGKRSSTQRLNEHKKTLSVLDYDKYIEA